MCPFSQGRAHFGKISALELNGQHTGRTNHRHLYSAHPILQIGSKRMGYGVKVNGVRECWESCQTLNTDMHQAVSPAETEVLTFSIDRLPKSDSLFQKAEDTTFPIQRLPPTLALSSFLGLCFTFPHLFTKKKPWYCPFPQTLASGYVHWGTGGGHSFLKVISRGTILNAIDSKTAKWDLCLPIVTMLCPKWEMRFSLRLMVLSSRWVTRRPKKFLQGVRKSSYTKVLKSFVWLKVI